MAKTRKAGVIAAIVVGLLAVGAVNSCVQSTVNAGGSDDSDTSYSYDSSSDSDLTTTDPEPEVTPTPTPTPIPDVVVTEHVGETAVQAQNEIFAQGLVPAFFDANGVAVPDATGWTVAAETPAAGNALGPGMTVRLTVTPPPPPVQPSQPEQQAPDQTGGATALCNDGTLSYSAHHQGTCSHHGGVAVWYK